MKKRDKLIKSGRIVTDKEMPIALLGISGVEQYGIKKVYGNILNAVTLDFLNMVTHRARERWMTQIDIDSGEITWTMLEEIWAEIPNMFNTIIISEYEIRKFFEKKFRKKYGRNSKLLRIVLSIGLTERMKEKRLNGVMKEMRTGFIYQKRREMFNNLLVMVLKPFNYDLITFPLLSSGVQQSLYGYLYRVLLYKTGNAVIIATSPKGSVAMPSAKEI